MIGNIHSCSLYSLISHENTSKNECMDRGQFVQHSWKQRIGDAHGDGMMPG